MSEINKKNRRLAEEAREKQATQGEDIDLKKFRTEVPEHAPVKKLDSLSQKEQLLSAGIDLDEKERSGTYMQMDHSVVHCSVRQDGLEILDIEQARQRYDGLRDYWWKAVKVDTDKYTAQTELQPQRGYFIRARKGTQSFFPLQACLYMGHQDVVQNVHNIIVAEEDSELHIITGCAVAKDVKRGLHLGISEFYVHKNAKITFTMVHNWAEDVMVRPRTGTIVEAGGQFLSNYICMRPVRSLQANPICYLQGEGAVARYNNIVVAPEGSHIDLGSRVVLSAPNTRAEVVSRTITTGGDIIARGELVGETKPIKAHLECRGLILSDKGMIHAIPELIGKVGGVDMSHEAAVGKIAEEEIEYLMARGLNQEEATATIVRGFLNVKIKGLPHVLKKEMDDIVRKLEEEAF